VSPRYGGSYYERKAEVAMCRWTAFWSVFFFVSFSYAQEPPQGSYAPSKAEISELVECEQSILGELSPGKGIRSGIYDLVYGQWLIKSERADEIIRCLVEKHGWVGLRARRMGVVALARRTRP